MTQCAIYVSIMTKYDRIWYTGERDGWYNREGNYV